MPRRWASLPLMALRHTAWEPALPAAAWGMPELLQEDQALAAQRPRTLVAAAAAVEAGRRLGAPEVPAVGTWVVLCQRTVQPAAEHPALLALHGLEPEAVPSS